MYVCVYVTVCVHVCLGVCCVCRVLVCVRVYICACVRVCVSRPEFIFFLLGILRFFVKFFQFLQSIILDLFPLPLILRKV
jgi:hypothetical protein